MKNKIKKLSKLLLVFGVLFTSFGLVKTFADGETPLIQFSNPSGVLIAKNENSIIYKKVISGTETKIGSVQISYKDPTNNDDYVVVEPTILNSNNVVQLPTFESFNVEDENITGYEARITFTPADGYEIRSNPTLKEESIDLPGGDEGTPRVITLYIKANGVIQYGNDTEYVVGPAVLSDVLFVLIGSPDGGDNPPPPLPLRYPLLAKFSGVEELVAVNDNDSVLVPENWTSGEVEFYAGICTTTEGLITPDDDSCSGTRSTIRVDIEGIVDDANGTATITGQLGQNNMKAILDENFSEETKTSYHLVTDDEHGRISKTVAIITSDYIGVKADAEMGMTFSLGSEMETQATVSSTTIGSVKIFYGNTETILRPLGISVEKIISVTGAESTTLNNDGSATVTLPNISKETTTQVTIVFKLHDGTEVTKKLNIIRTTITLGYSNADGESTLYAGYVANKNYLYNNLSHDASGFDAYLQVILYKDNAVVGYRQVQINDEDFVDNLQIDETNGIEWFDKEHAIKLAGTGTDFSLDGVNGASVFLTNGSIDYNSDTLPSIEFGIGAGVKIAWEAR